MNEFELEQEMSRTALATHLRTLADGLESGEKVTLIVGDESVTVNPPETLHVKIETESDSSWLGGDDGQSMDIELGWAAEEVEQDEELTIVKQPNRSEPDRAVRSTD